MSQSALAISLFFHISATVLWIGGLLLTVLLVWPEVRRTLEGQPRLYFMLSRWRTRFYPIGNIALAVLIVTGLFQMTADPSYEGLFAFDNTWSRVMLVKHIVIVLMVAAGALLQYGISPELERTSLLLQREKGDVAAWGRLRQREVLLTWVNALLGVAVLALSAWATSI
jgi:uncharacterized membrane protein